MRLFFTVPLVLTALLVVAGCASQTTPNPITATVSPNPLPVRKIAIPSPTVPFDPKLFEPSKEEAARDKMLRTRINERLDASARKRIYWEIWMAEDDAHKKAKALHPEPRSTAKNWLELERIQGKRLQEDEEQFTRQNKERLARKWGLTRDGMDMLKLIGSEGMTNNWPHPD